VACLTIAVVWNVLASCNAILDGFRGTIAVLIDDGMTTLENCLRKIALVDELRMSGVIFDRSIFLC